jgi:hypothetical protein
LRFLALFLTPLILLRFMLAVKSDLPYTRGAWLYAPRSTSVVILTKSYRLAASRSY